MDPSILVPDTLGKFVPIPMLFNAYTGFGQIEVHPGWRTPQPARATRTSRHPQRHPTQARLTPDELTARHRAHALVEDRIRHAKDSRLGRFPFRGFAINTARPSWPRSAPTSSPGCGSWR